MSNDAPKHSPDTDADTGEGSMSQTDKPWKGNPEKEQRNDGHKPDLEKWHKTNTH